MTFEEYRNNIFFMLDSEKSAAKQVWNYQQRRIEKLEWDLADVKRALTESNKMNSFLNGRLEALQDDLKERKKNNGMDIRK